MSVQAAIVAHYSRDDLIARIDSVLAGQGKDPARLTIDDLAPVDEFHSRGRAATEELAACLPAGTGEVLDVGSGLGGPARYLAAKFGRRVAGIDLTPAYVATAQELTRRCGLDDRVRFMVGDALELPFPDGGFEAACTQHVAMNIADKASLYAGIARVLRPGATFVIHDILAGSGGSPRYPTPWSADGTTSFLVAAPALADLLAAAGFKVEEMRDRRAATVAWFEARQAKGDQPLGIQLLLGDRAKEALANLLDGLRAGAFVPTLVHARRA